LVALAGAGSETVCSLTVLVAAAVAAVTAVSPGEATSGAMIRTFSSEGPCKIE
jgi:hypothetical protein